FGAANAGVTGCSPARVSDNSMALVRQFAERQDWLITADQLKQRGMSRSQVDQRLRSGEYRAVLKGVYLVDADMYNELPERVLWRAALLGHGPASMLVGRTGARAWGVAGLPPYDEAVEVALVGGISRMA